MKCSHIFVSDVAFIQYDRCNNVLDYKETQVPPAFRRKGVAQILAEVRNLVNARHVANFSNTISTTELHELNDAS
jgi:hypothetical protein